jgi:tetratricopeptide (TPR) repeat protein
MARLNLKQTDSAIEDCQKALQLDPDSKLAHGNLGIGYTHKGMYQEAITEFQKDMTLNPDTPSTSYTNIGYIYIQLKQYPEAVNTLQKAIEQDPKNIVGQYNLGIAYLDLKDYPNAISHLEKTLQLDPNYHIAHYHLGLSYCYNHQPAKAKHEYQQLLKSDSQNTPQMKAMLDQYCS